MAAQISSTFNQRPASIIGKWAAGFCALFVIMFLINSAVLMPLNQVAGRIPEPVKSLLPFYGITMMLAGLISGVLAFIAVARHERSWMVWLALLPGIFAVIFLLGEFLIPH